MTIHPTDRCPDCGVNQMGAFSRARPIHKPSCIRVPEFVVGEEIHPFERCRRARITEIGGPAPWYDDNWVKVVTLGPFPGNEMMVHRNSCERV